jgi:hypothetical protein
MDRVGILYQKRNTKNAEMGLKNLSFTRFLGFFTSSRQNKVISIKFFYAIKLIFSTKSQKK